MKQKHGLAIEALCNTIADLRKRIAELENPIVSVQASFPQGTKFFSDGRPPEFPYGPSELVDNIPHERALDENKEWLRKQPAIDAPRLMRDAAKAAIADVRIDDLKK